MSCSEARNLITRQLYEALEPTANSRLTTHLAKCAVCTSEQEVAIRLESRLRALYSSESPMVVPVVNADASRVFAQHRATWTSRLDRRSYLALAGGVAVAGIVAVLIARPTNVAGVVPTPVSTITPPRPKSQPGVVDPPQGLTVQRRPRPLSPPLSPRLTQRPASASTMRTVHQPSTPITDEAYLDGRDSALGAAWLAGDSQDRRARAWLERQLPAMRDDFVRVPLPRVAAADPRSAAEAVKKYELEAKTVDVRLVQKVTLQVKAESLDELCAQLSRQTRVKLSASRGVANEKATVLVKELPARDVMRAVARLFGYVWSRSGSEGAFRYVLTQDLRSQLAEQEMRTRDLNEALLALDEKMADFEPVVGLSPSEIKERLAQAKGDQRRILARSSGLQWGGIQLYHRLTPAERAALGQGKPLSFSSDATRPGQQIPPAWARSVLGTWEMGITADGPDGRSTFGQIRFLQQESKPYTPIEDSAGATAAVELKVDHSELGRVSLKANTSFSVSLNGGSPGLGSNETLAEAQSPSVARPDNRVANSAFKLQPPFERLVTLKPVPSCPTLRAELQQRKPGEPAPTMDQIFRESAAAGRPLSSADVENLLRLRSPHLNTADIWEAVHLASGLPVVADSYSRLYDPKSVPEAKLPLFVALCHASDEMGVRWRKDGQFLLARSTSYFWDKLKEVPNSDLERWRKSKAERAGFPFDDLVDMAQLVDEQLDSQRVGEVVGHCWGLPEWELLQRPIGYYSPRPWLRWLSNLPLGARAQALSPAGLALHSLTPAAQQEVVDLLGIQGGEPRELHRTLPERRLRIGYASEGSYEWVPRLGPGRDQNQAAVLPVVSAGTQEAALEAAQRIDPSVTPAEIRRSGGTLVVTVLTPGGISWNAAGVRHLR